MMSYNHSTRATGASDGHAYAAGGQWATGAENGVMKGGTFKTKASQRFVDFPGEQPSLGEVECWQQNARSKMTDDQKAVVRNKYGIRYRLSCWRIRLRSTSRTSRRCRLARPNRW